MSESASILETLGSARRFADPAAPVEARLMAARGALPLPPDRIASVLFALTFDPEPEVKQRAVASLEQLPDRILDPTLSASVHPALLSWLARRVQSDAARVEKLALNPATSDETICELAALPYGRVIDIVANNQTRLLRCPGILDALGANPLTSPATIDRILEFLGVRKEAAADEPPPPPPDAPVEVADADVLAAAALDDPSGLPPELLEENEAAQAEPSEERSKTLFALIQDMKVVDKIKLARFGNGEARGLLVRDRNRIVATAVVRSPKIKENEVISIAKSRNVTDEVLRLLSNLRTWTASYPVQLALASNPKTPVPSAIKFLNYLTDRDLRTIMRSREVPGPISTQARRILARKGKV